MAHHIARYTASFRLGLKDAQHSLVFLLCLFLLVEPVVRASAPFYRLSAQGGASPNPVAQAEQDVRPLEPGKPIERELACGQSHSYKVTVGAGQYMQVVVDQRGIDVVVTLFAPDGKQEMDVNLTGPGGLEALSYEASASGDYRITVRALGAVTFSGSYQVRLEIRAATT